jgi:hypothetical protein
MPTPPECLVLFDCDGILTDMSDLPAAVRRVSC